MKTIHKFAVYSAGNFRLSMPTNAKVLSVQIQFDRPQLWAEVDTTQEHEYRDFEVFGTGQEVPAIAEYVGTFQLSNGGFIGHLYEVHK